jgi:anti-sigma B factor antagonist
MVVPTEARPMNASMYLVIIAEHHRQRSVLRLQGELDVSNRNCLRHVINSALQHHPATVVVDLSGLNFTDCAGLSVLVWAHKRLAGQGQQLVMTGAKPIVQRLLHIADLDAYLHLSPAEAPNDNPDESTYT